MTCATGYECTVNVGGVAGWASKINGNSATKLDVITDWGNDNLNGATISCGSSECSVYCGAGTNKCKNLNVRAESATSLLVTCDNSSAWDNTCDNLDIWCPSETTGNKTCTLVALPDTAKMDNARIYSRHGFNTFEIVNGAAGSFGAMQCSMSYNNTCDIDTVNNQCAGSAIHICDAGI